MHTGAMWPALRIAGIYTFLGALWIAASDKLVMLMSSDAATGMVIQTYKGWAFVLVSGLLIYCFLNRELTSRIKAEESLAIAMDAAQLGDWDSDLTRNVISRSPRHDQIFGYDALQPEWNYEIFLAHVLPEDRDHVTDSFERSFTTGDLRAGCRILWPDGTLHWIEIRGRTYFDKDNRPIRMAGVLMDATERNKSEAALLSGERMLKRMLAASPVGIGLSQKRKMIWVNEAWARMFGFEDTSQCMGQEAKQRYVSEEEFQRTGAVLYRKLESGVVNETDTKMVMKDGATFDACILMAALDPEDLGAGELAVISDISKRKAAEAALEKSEATLKGILQVAQMGIGLLANRQIVWVNRMVAQMTGYRRRNSMAGTQGFCTPVRKSTIAWAKSSIPPQEKKG